MTREQTKRSVRGQAPSWWYVVMAFGGLSFGALADRRPFGEGFLVHPLAVFFILVALGLIALRVLLARPVPEVISDRALFAGCVVGLVAFLAGNFASVYLLHSIHTPG
jgi:hypothetical protein